MVASPECAVTASADWLYMGKFLLTHAGFGAVVLLLLVPKLYATRGRCTPALRHHRALHSTNAVIALWTIALGKSLVVCPRGASE